MKPTEQQLQDIYEEAVSAECAEKQGEEMSSFDLLCKLDEAGGLATFIRTMIDTLRATRSQQPAAYLNDAHLGRGHVEGEVGEEGDAPGMIPVYREPLDCLYIRDTLTELERAELEDYRRCVSEDREMLKRLAVILSGSDAPGEIRSLTVTAQSFVDRCKTLAKERELNTGFPVVLPCPVFLDPGLRFGKGVSTRVMLDALQRRAEYYAELDAMTPEDRAEHEANIADLKSMFPQREAPSD